VPGAWQLTAPIRQCLGGEPSQVGRPGMCPGPGPHEAGGVQHRCYRRPAEDQRRDAYEEQRTERIACAQSSGAGPGQVGHVSVVEIEVLIKYFFYKFRWLGNMF
jgi:hypothetical protein